MLCVGPDSSLMVCVCVLPGPKKKKKKALCKVQTPTATLTLILLFIQPVCISNVVLRRTRRRDRLTAFSDSSCGGRLHASNVKVVSVALWLDKSLVEKRKKT